LSIVNWNIQHGVPCIGTACINQIGGRDVSRDVKQMRLQNTIRVLRSLRPNIVSLQEIDKGCGWSRRWDQPKKLTAAVLRGFKSVWFTGRPKSMANPNCNGNAVFTKFKLASSKGMKPSDKYVNKKMRCGHLKLNKSGFPTLEMKVPGMRKTLLITSVHVPFCNNLIDLKSGPDVMRNCRAANPVKCYTQDLLRHFATKRFRSKPHIVMGDWNSGSSGVFEYLRTHPSHPMVDLLAVCQSQNKFLSANDCTRPADQSGWPKSCQNMDKMFIPKWLAKHVVCERFRIVSTLKGKKNLASDHLPVHAVIRFKGL